MSLLGPTLVLYLLVGVGVAAALYLTDPPRPLAERVLRLTTAVPFWPFYLPILLTAAAPRPETTDACEDELSRAIAQVEAELDGVFENREGRERIEGLRAAWRERAERVREMDRLLARPEYTEPAEETGPAQAPRVRQSLAARRQNVERLRRLRQRAEADLLASLALVRELVSRVHLARFTGAAEPRVDELLAEIAAAVENLSVPPPPEEETHFFKRAE